MEGIQTAEIPPCYCHHLFPFKEGTFGAVWALDGSNSNSQTRHVSNSTINSRSEFVPLQMVQENSMRAPSYFYSVEHASRKSFYHVLNLSGEKPPNMDENGLPGEQITIHTAGL